MQTLMLYHLHGVHPKRRQENGIASKELTFVVFVHSNKPLFKIELQLKTCVFMCHVIRYRIVTLYNEKQFSKSIFSATVLLSL